MAKPRRRLELPEGALKKLQQERAQHIEGHLEQWGNITSIKNQAIDLALSKDIAYAGVPQTDVEQEELLERCVRMGEKIALERLARYNNGVKEICELLNVRDLPDFVVWSALKAGGVQLPVTEVEELPEPSKLITEH